MRLETVLLSPHVAAGPSEMWIVDSTVLFAKLGEATAPVYLLYTKCHSLNGRVVPTLDGRPDEFWGTERTERFF